MHCISFVDSPSRHALIIPVAVHLFISTATSFVGALLALNAINFDAPITLVFGVTLVFNIFVFGIVEIMYMPGHLRSDDRILGSEMKEVEEGKKIVLWCVPCLF